jgi:hypothetical protein
MSDLPDGSVGFVGRSPSLPELLEHVYSCFNRHVSIQESASIDLC